MPGKWWHLYEDKTLDGLIEEALRNNTDLRIAAANIKRAEAYKAEIADRAKPQTELGGGVSYGQLSAEEHLIFGHALPSDFVYSLGGGLSYDLDLAGQIKRAIEAAKAESEASRAAYDAVRIGVVAEVSRSYLDVCAAGRELDLAEEMISVQDSLKSVNARLTASGRAAENTRQTYNAQLWRIRAALPVLQARRKQAAYRLAALMGSDIPPDVMGCHAVPELKAPVPVGDGRAFLERRPDVREAEAGLKAATARIGVAMADLYPHITLGISGGSTGLLKNIGDSDTYKYSIGPLISWEFPQRGTVEARIRAAEARDEAALALFDRTVLNALRDAEISLSAYGRDLDQNGDWQRAEAAQARLAADSIALQQRGRQSLTETLLARRNHLQAEQDVAASKARLAADQISLFAVLGGGW
ncbi:efflux transporter outer membrane subunit [Rhizomicrobium palustre]